MWLALLVVLKVGAASLTVELPAGEFVLGDREILGWIERAASATARLYGRFPVARARIEIEPKEGRGISGTTWPNHEIDVPLGRQVTAADLADDWVMTHEMIHLGFPTLARRHHWMEEGLATYAEPLARGLPPEKIWRDLVEGLPQGLPQTGDRGLDFTPTWGRTYWGGALFWLCADIEIHERTGNRKGIADALRGIVASGGTVDASWRVERVVAAGDRATGVPVLAELYRRMKDRPAPVDLDDLWKRLGVSLRDGKIAFDDGAPLAKVRRAITEAITEDRFSAPPAAPPP
jgi:hypothetical protein